MVSQWWPHVETVRGAQHVRESKPLQDSGAFLVGDDFLVMAVADGHGHEKAVHSKIGADLAVQTAHKVLSRFHDQLHGVKSEQDTKDDHASVLSPEKIHSALQVLPRNLSYEWRRAVAYHYVKSEGENDATQDRRDETKLISFDPVQEEEREDTELQVAVAHEVLRLYGTTLLVVYLTAKFAVLVQIGDGSIFVVGEDGSVTEPVPVDQRQIFNSVTSLSDRNAHEKFRITEIYRLDSAPPALFVVCTDGFVNSFKTDEYLLGNARKYLDTLRSKGTKYVETHHKDWLEHLTENASGDDITVGLLWHTDNPSLVMPTSQNLETA